MNLKKPANVIRYCLLVCLSIVSILVLLTVIGHDVPFELFGVVLFCFTMSIVLLSSDIEHSHELELKKIKKEREIINHKIEDEETKSSQSKTVDLIRLNLNQLTEYYSINKNQAKSSYYLSILFVSVGFAALIACILIALYSKDSKMTIAIISGVSGILLQFLGGANFFLYNKSLEQVNRFYDQLVKMQDTMLAVDIIQQVDERKNKLLMTEVLVNSLIERNHSLDNLASESNNKTNSRIKKTFPSKFNSKSS